MTATSQNAGALGSPPHLAEVRLNGDVAEAGLTSYRPGHVAR
jgi:hypothetical protein